MIFSPEAQKVLKNKRKMKPGRAGDRRPYPWGGGVWEPTTRDHTYLLRQYGYILDTQKQKKAMNLCRHSAALIVILTVFVPAIRATNI